MANYNQAIRSTNKFGRKLMEEHKTIRSLYPKMVNATDAVILIMVGDLESVEKLPEWLPVLTEQDVETEERIPVMLELETGKLNSFHKQGHR